MDIFNIGLTYINLIQYYQGLNYIFSNIISWSYIQFMISTNRDYFCNMKTIFDEFLIPVISDCLVCVADPTVIDSSSDYSLL